MTISFRLPLFGLPEIQGFAAQLFSQITGLQGHFRIRIEDNAGLIGEEDPFPGAVQNGLRSIFFSLKFGRTFCHLFGQAFGVYLELLIQAHIFDCRRHLVGQRF